MAWCAHCAATPSARSNLGQSGGQRARRARPARLTSSHRQATRRPMNPPLPLHTLRGLRVAVTGGTSGLGRALVQALHASGADVAFVARDASRVAQLARTLPGSHGIAGDVSIKEDV